MIICSSAVRSNASLEVAMETVSQAGFEYIDILAINTWCHINPADLVADYDGVLAYLEGLLEKYQLKMGAMNIGFTYQMHDRRPESVAQNLKECAALCRLMQHFGVTAAALQPLQRDDTRDRWEVVDDCIVSLGEYYKCAEEYGVKLGLELHINSPFEDLDVMEYLFSKIPTAGIVYDPSHFTTQGMGLKRSEFIIKNCVHSHLRDSGEGNIQAPLGEGDVDFDWVADKLAEHGYMGHFSIEYLANNDWDAINEAVKMKELIESNEKFGKINK